MSDCPRVYSREQIIEGLRAGRVFCVDRIDAPELADLREMEEAGLVTSRLVTVDDQYSVRKFRWAGEAAGTELEQRPDLE